MNIGVNFFGPKRKLYRDFDGTLDILKGHGITSAEICVAFSGNGEPPKELKLKIPSEILKEMSGGIWGLDGAAQRLAEVRRHGFTVVSCHVMMGAAPSPQLLVDLTPALLKFGSENNISYFVISLMKGLEAIKGMAAAVNELAHALAQKGMALVYHNHEVELLPEEGTTALDYLMEQCPDLKLELDVGWAKFAGASPVELMEKYRNRIVLLHFKDIRADASPATRDTCFTAVGEGSIPLKEILAAAPSCPIDEYGFIIDQDDSPTDILDDLAVGAQNILRAR